MQNAVLARAYGDSPTLRRMTEAREDNLRNISKALLRVAPRVAEARERIDAGTLNDADLTGDLLAAVEGLGALRERGWSVDDELGQADLTGPKYSPESAALLRFLADNLRAPRRIAEFVQRYYEALEQAGDPSQGTMFDDGAPAPTRAELLQRAQGEPDGNDPAAPGQGGDRQGAGAAREGGEQRAAAPGDQGGDQGAGPARADAGGGQQGAQEGEAEWVMYPPESGTLGIPRAQMPQVKKRDRAALVQFLEARGISYEIQDDTDPNTLKPTQAEYQPSKAHSFAQSGDKERSVLVSREGHVLDGHHQWMGAQEAGDTIRVIRFDAPIEELLEATFEFPSVQRSEGAPGVAEVALIDGRPYDPERDNFQPPPLAEVLPADVLQRADAYVERFYKAAKPYPMTPDERAVGERLLAPRLELARVAKVEFDQKVIDLAERVGALGQILGNIKSTARAVEKMHQEAKAQGRPMRAEDVKDLLRATLVVDQYPDADAVVDAVEREFVVLRTKDRRDEQARSAQDGYADVLMQIELPSGITAEIQINVPSMLAAKGGQGHKLYEAARVLPEGDPNKSNIAGAMRDLYAAAFDAAALRAKNSRDLAAVETKPDSDMLKPERGPSGSMPGSAMSESPSSDALNQVPSGKRTNSSPEKSPTNRQSAGKDSGNFIDEPRDDILSDPSGNGYTAEVEQPQGTRLSRGAGAGGVDAGGGMDFDQLKALAERIKAGMPNMPNVRVLPDPSKAPKALREYIVRQDAWDDVEGAMHDGELYLFASGLSDPLRAEHVLAEHEAAHYGLRGILGDKLRVAMNVIYAENGTVRRAANKLRATSRLTVAEAVEEVIVDMPTRELARLQGWRRLVGLVRDTLAARGFERMADRLTGWLHGTLSDQQRADLMVAELVRGAREFVAGKRPGERTIAAATRLSSTLAEDIERQEKWLTTEARARGYKDVDDLVDQNYPLFERLAELWRERNPADTLLSRRKGLAERVEDILGKPAATMKPLDAMARAATRYSGLERLTSAVYDRAAYLLDRYTPEQVKAGVVADYGVPQTVIDQRVMLQGRQRVQLRKAGKLVDKLATLTREESRVAYEWMNMDGSDPKAYLSKMDGLPEESVEVLLEVQKLVDDLSKEAVRLGQLTPEAFERNRFAYLRRSYAKHVVEMTAGEKAKRARVISILGEQYRGRGLTEAADMDKLKAAAPEWWGRKLKAGKADTALKGEKFIRLERRETKGAGVGLLPGIERDTSAGKLREVAYWPADEKLPPQLKDWQQAGTFEVRDVKGPKAILWRDFTKDERERMGEVDEARFAIAKTLHAMIHDVEVGRYLEWMSTNQAKKEGEEIPGAVVEASERMRDTFKPGEWVRVPDTKIAGTSVLKYGKLAGRYLPGPVWNDIRQVVGGQFKPFGETYSKILSLWKTSKTALSPAVHMNNVMSNFIMADWHGVTAGHVAKSLRILMGASQRKGQGLLGKAGNLAARGGIADHEAAREILARYEDSGGDIGSWVTNEIARDQLEPLLQSLEKELQQTAGASHQAQTGVFAALQHMLMLRFPSAWEAFKPTVPGKVLATEANNLIELYQHEDDVFRLAAWLRAKEEGASDIEAGRAARKSFLDYSINAPWIQAMRQSAWPFISFTYRAVPMLAEIAGKKPHKLLKLMMVLGGLNALGSMLAGGDDDDDERARKLLPEEKAGKIWGIVPKLIRMPWNDEHGSPVYLDIRRFIPVGDVFDVGAGQAAIPVLPGLMPGGPLVLAGEVMLNKSAFTGKSISQDTDTAAQQAAKVADHLYKAFAPNIVVLPNTYAWEGVEGSLTGRTDAFGREMSTTQALLSSVGVKLGSYPADVLRRNLVAKTKAQEAEIDKNITQLKRQLQTNRVSREEFDEAVQVEREKKAKLLREMAEKLR
ncbi:nucleotidyltransferase family protein [Hydrogenophaga intermedia]|nr:hypothetical protein [Hydrogenophaga intermedia]TMU77320.1 hypothetical protein FGJ01_05560 [Hydrogenophaga intermedia]